MIAQQKRFRVVFTGEFESTQDVEIMKAKLSKRFNLKPAVLERMMAGRPIVVKNNVDAEIAYKYKAEIDAMGGISRIEPLPYKNDVDEKGYIERRELIRRFRSDRRTVGRAGSMQPDRRKKDRRDKDK